MYQDIRRKEEEESFNPYFNGYSTLTSKLALILALPSCFNPYFNGYSTLTQWRKRKNKRKKGVVSILILMDTLL